MRTSSATRKGVRDEAASARPAPLGWATNGSEDGWYRQTGDYPATVEALIQAGAKLPKKIEGSDAVREVLRRYGVRD